LKRASFARSENAYLTAMRASLAAMSMKPSKYPCKAECIVRIKDTGAGISGHERDIVPKRFCRSDKPRGAPGFGLGLDPEAAIVKLHGFRLTVHPGSSCVIEIPSPDQRADGEVKPER
jgi:K+-sensing histidine kinase KdpD